MSTMELSLLLLHLQLHLLNVFLHALHLEVITLQLTLNRPFGAPLLFELLGGRDEHLVLLKFNGVTLPPQLSRLRQQLLFFALVCVQVTS